MAEPRRPELSRRPRALKEYIIAFAGLVAAGITFFGVRAAEQDAARMRFEARTNEQAAALTRSVDELRYVLRSLEGAHQMMAGLSRNDFREVVQRGMQRREGIVEALYVPVLEPEDRAGTEQSARRDGYDDFVVHDRSGAVAPAGITTRPLLYVVPAPDASRFGLDLSSDEAFMAAARGSVDAGTLLSTPTRVVEGRSVASLVAPIYAQDAPTFTRVGRRAFVVGHVVLRFSPEAVLRHAVAGLVDPDIDLHLVAGDLSVAVGAQAPAKSAPLYENGVDYPGEQWRIQSAARPEFYVRHRTSKPFAAAGAVVLLAAFVLFAFRQQRLQKQVVEREVRARSAELAAARATCAACSTTSRVGSSP